MKGITMKTKQQLIKEVSGKTPAEQRATDVLIVIALIIVISIIGAILSSCSQEEVHPAAVPVKCITTCILKQNNEIHEYPNCTVVNEKYARLN